MLVKIKQLTIHALNEATNSPDMLAADQQEIENLLTSIDRISENTEFGGKKLLDGSMGTNGTAVGESLSFVSAKPTSKDSPEQGWEVDILQIATRSHMKGTIAIDAKNIQNGVQILINEGGKNISLNTADGQLGKDIEQMIDDMDQFPLRFPFEKVSSEIREMVIYALNQRISENGLHLQVLENPDKTLMIQHKNFGDSSKFSASSSIEGILSLDANIAQSAVLGKNIEGTINDELALGDGQYLSSIEGMEAGGITVKYEKELGYQEIPVFDDSGIKTDTLLIEEKNEDIVGGPNNPKIEGYVHIAQKSKEFQIGEDKKSYSTFSFANVRTSALGKSTENKSGFNSLADINVKTVQGAKDAAKIVDKVIDQISVYRGELGSFQKNTLESNLTSLKVAEENITEAESTLRDSDMAAELSNLTKDQIMLEASTAMIAQANQAPKTVLSLIQNRA